jgi:charged multivesicular body protein 4
MDSIREQMDLTNEISDAISNPVGMGNQVDEVSRPVSCCTSLPATIYAAHLLVYHTHKVDTDIQDELKAELEALEQEELDDRLAGAERAPIHAPTSPVGVTSGRERMSFFNCDLAIIMSG